MKLPLSSLVCMVILLLIIVCGNTDGWLNGGSSGYDRSSCGGSPSRNPGARKSITSKVASNLNKLANSARSAVNRGIGKVKSGAKFVAGAAQGSVEMGKAYVEMREANTIGADKYFHAKGNNKAASHGPGGKWAAKVISDTREAVQMGLGESAADSAADQRANLHGRSGGDPNVFRPKSLDKKYRK